MNPLTDAEAETAIFALANLFDGMGCCPAMLIDGKEDEGVSFRLYFPADCARKLISERAASGTDARQRPDPEEGLDPKGDGPAPAGGDAQ